MTSFKNRRNNLNVMPRISPPFGCRSMAPVTVVGATVLLVFALSLLFSSSSSVKVGSKDRPQSTRPKGATSVITIQPERRVLHFEKEDDANDGVEYFFQIPLFDDHASTRLLRGIVLLFHGCNHDGIDWFELPEERRILRSSLLQRGFAVISVSSKDRHGSRCWSYEFPPEVNPDVVRIVATLPALLQEIQDMQQQNPTPTESVLPLYAIGASSGGMFIPILHHALPLRGMSVMISPGHEAAWQALGKVAEQTPHPPLPRIAFVFMPRDTSFAGQAQIDHIVQDFLMPIQNLSVQVYRCDPIPITVDLLAERIDTLTHSQGETIVQRLGSPPLNMIAPVRTAPGDTQQTTTDSLLTKDPRAVWRSIEEMLIREEAIQTERLLIDSMREILNVAYGVHELTSEHMNSVVDFWIEDA